MSLKSNVVIVNEYSVPLPGGRKGGAGNGGSRGGTPGDYITRYMARELATEPVTPIRLHRTDDFILRYMARADATERFEPMDPRGLKREMARAQGEGGVAFGYGEVSLSDEQLTEAAGDVQSLFDRGHTAMKTVLSFDQEYLRKHKIIPEDFVCERRGDYRGHVDQMKLRMAIMHGLDRMGRALYDDLRYVGVIQVDTEHVHCHLAMVDAGEGTKAADGTQKGKINERAKSLLRRGLDSWLDEKQHVKHLSSAVGYERRNVTSYVKKWAHQQMLRETLPQFLISCLPEDRRMWRLSTNHESMRKPNRIVRELVEDILERPGSPMVQVMEQVHAYADHRRELEDLSRPQWERLVETGRSQVIERGVNAVYATLRQLPEDTLALRTPLLSAMSMDYEHMAQSVKSPEESAEDDILGFSFRLRSYASRMEHHTEQREEFHQRARSWAVADETGVARDASRVLYEFYLEEEEYHARVAAKYRSFLAFAPETHTWYESWDEVAQYGERLLSLESMRKDQSLRKLKDLDEAERVGREVYGQAGGHLVSLGDEDSLASLDQRVAKMRTQYARKISDLRVQLAGQGLVMRLERGEQGEHVPVISRGAEYSFESVRGLDLHHMRYDFTRDVEVGVQAREEFSSWAERRAGSLAKAVEYLEGTGQQEAIVDLPVADVTAMTTLAARMTPGDKGLSVLPSRVAEITRSKDLLRRSATVSLTQSLSAEMTQSVEQSAREPWQQDLEAEGAEPAVREAGQME